MLPQRSLTVQALVGGKPRSFTDWEPLWVETLLSSFCLLAQRGAPCGRSAVGKDRAGEKEQGQVSESLVSHAYWILLLVHKIGNFFLLQ